MKTLELMKDFIYSSCKTVTEAHLLFLQIVHDLYISD